MSNPETSVSTLQHCPHLGLQADPVSSFTEPVSEHRCYVTSKPQTIDLSHQTIYCLTAFCTTCPRYTPRPSTTVTHSPRRVEVPQAVPRSGWFGRLSRRERVGLGALSLFSVAFLLVYFTLTLAGPRTVVRSAPAAATEPLLRPVATTNVSLAALSKALPSPTPTASPAPSATPRAFPPTPTIPSGLVAAVIPPAPNHVGWASSGETTAKFGDRSLRVGVLDNQVYYGLLQFNLATIPYGSRIEYAAIEVVGLNAEMLQTTGAWTLHLLDDLVVTDGSSVTFDRLRDATGVAIAEAPAQELAPRQLNTFVLSPEVRTELERRLAKRSVAFRLSGPMSGSNLFIWDTGYGGAGGYRPILRVFYQAAPTLTPFIVTAVPSPANLATLAARVATGTAQVAQFGTATPEPPNLITATPPVIVTNTPTPENQATADWVAVEATAEALLRGTPTPLPAGVWTATPAPPTVPAPTRRPPPVPPTWTPTPLPLLIPLEDLPPTPTRTPTRESTPTPAALPSILNGKIAFTSDSFGKEVVFVVNPDGSGLALLTDTWAYKRARELEQYSPDGVHRLFIKTATNTIERLFEKTPVPVNVPSTEIWVQNTADGWQWPLIQGPRITYDPVWSPDGVHIAFVSQEAGNDEIYVVNRHTRHETRVTNNTWQWDKHPSWSPDGAQLVFWSNRESGRKNIWVVNADGSDPHPLLDDDSNNWDPVWFK